MLASKIYTKKEYKEIKRKITRMVENSKNEFLIDYYYKNFDKFIVTKNNLFKSNNKNISMEEIRLLNYINKFNIDELRYIIKNY